MAGTTRRVIVGKEAFILSVANARAFGNNYECRHWGSGVLLAFNLSGAWRIRYVNACGLPWIRTARRTFTTFN